MCERVFICRTNEFVSSVKEHHELNLKFKKLVDYEYRNFNVNFFF